MYWTVQLEGGPRRVNHTAVAVGDHIYSFGGYCSGEDYRSFSTIDVHVLNIHTMRWHLVPPKRNETGKPVQYPDAPYQRYGHTAVAYKHRVFMWGGRNDERGCNILFCFDTKSNTWSKPDVRGDAPGVRDGHSACIVDQFMYIFGGFEEDINQFSQDVYCLNLETMIWKFILTTGIPPSYRDFHTATILNGRMYVFGGRGDRYSPNHSQEELYCSQIVYLDLKSRLWHTPNALGAVPLGRRSHSAFVYNSRLYIFGGYNALLDTHFNDLYCFEPVQQSWSLVKTNGKLPRVRRRQMCLVIGTKMYLFGGTSPVGWVTTTGPNQVLMDFSDTHILDFQPTLKTLAIMAVLENNIDQSGLPHNIRMEIRAMTTPNVISRPLNNTG